MTVSGAMTFTVRSFVVTTNPAGVPAFVQAKGDCSGASFRRLTIGISAGGTSSPGTDPAARNLSINIPQATFTQLLGTLQVLPCLITISYAVGEGGTVCVTGIAFQSLVPNVQVLMSIAESSKQLEVNVQQIAQHLIKKQ